MKVNKGKGAGDEKGGEGGKVMNETEGSRYRGKRNMNGRGKGDG